jgi:regulator of sirC expression with transglutaminase-like and TPR domain
LFRDLKKLLPIGICCVTAVLLSTLSAFAGEKDSAQLFTSQSLPPDVEKEIDALLSMPEEKIDIGIAALTLEKEIYSALDIDVYSALIDHTVGRAIIMTNGSTDPTQRITVLNKLLYEIIGIKYAFSDPFGEKNIKVRHLKGVLDSRKGNCVSIPLLYLAIAQRLGYPVYAVLVPDHLFLRYVDPSLKQQNIEASSNGGYMSDEEYIKELQISEQGIKSGAYLRPLSQKEFLARLVAENAIYWGQHGDIKRAIKYFEHSVKVLPNSPEINDNLGRAYLIYSQHLEGEEAKEYVARGQSYKAKAIELGLVRPSREAYIKRLKEEIQESSQRISDDTNERQK